MAKYLKEGKDIGGFAIEGKGKGRNTKGWGGGGGKYSEGEQHAPSEPSGSKKEVASGAD